MAATLHSFRKAIRTASLFLLLFLKRSNSFCTLESRRSVFTSSLHAAKRAPAKRKSQRGTTVAVNRIAYRNYEIIETLEAGISLTGTEIKAIRDGKLNLRDGYIRPGPTSCVLHNVHIGKCSQVGNTYFQHEERRVRQLLVHKSESRKLKQQVDRQGMTVVPLKAYFNDQNRLKLQIALVRGKNVRDKRETIKARDVKRETGRIIKNFGL